jgi:membrane fusion protein (multidrug efflux system)
MIIMVCCVLALVAALAFGFFLHIRQMMANSPKPEPQSVSTVTVQNLEWQPQSNAVGTLSAIRGVDISSEIAGLVREVHFKSGQDVKAGDVLIQLNADADVAQLQALEAAADLAAVVLRRDTAQLQDQAISQAQVDADTADLKTKRALAVEQAATVAKKTIRAPFAGRLGITTINPGQYLNPGDKIVTLQTLDPIYIDFYLPQKQVGQISVGMVTRATSDAYAGQVFTGKITSISPKVDPATRNVQVQATLANPQRLLLPGMFGHAVVDAAKKKSYLTLPQTALTYNPYGSTVFVVTSAADAKDAKDSAKDGGKDSVKDDKGDAKSAAPSGDQKIVKQVFVTTGETRGDQVAITKGLTEGQVVVSSGQLKLKNGTPVVVDNSVQPANSRTPTPQEH